MIQAEQLHARILEELDLSRDIPDEELTELIHRVLDEASGREYIPLGKRPRYSALWLAGLSQ